MLKKFSKWFINSKFIKKLDHWYYYKSYKFDLKWNKIRWSEKNIFQIKSH